MLNAEDVPKGSHWRKRNKERAALAEKKSSLKRKYGLSWEDYVELYNLQKGCCPICGSFMKLLPEKNCLISTCVDHDHATGKVRGLLCRPCNLGLGNFRESKEALLKAVEYLKNVGR